MFPIWLNGLCIGQTNYSGKVIVKSVLLSNSFIVLYMMKTSIVLIVFIASICGESIIAQENSNSLIDRKNKSKNEIFYNLGQAVRNGGFSMKGYWIWDNSVIKGDDNKYHLFCSRWPDSIPFHPGWMVASEIVHAVSNVPQGPYHFSDVVFKARGAQYWDGSMTHNPSIQKYKGKYYLFYIGSNHPFSEPASSQLTLSSQWCIVSRSNKRIGLAVSDSPYGPWIRFDKPILETKPNTFYSYLTSNPTPLIQEDGSVLLIFKGRGHNTDNSFTKMALGIAYAKTVEGPYTVLNNEQPIFNAENQGEAEDPFLWQDERGYHLIFKDQLSKYTGEKGGGVLAHSKDAIHWSIDNSPKAYSRTVEWDDGIICTQGQMERPFILFENKKPVYLFFATMDGPGGFENSSKSWSMVIPFKKTK